MKKHASARTLRAQGIVRLKPVRRAHAERAEGARRYGYTAAHRHEDISPYSTNLTDAEWELVSDLFERVPGQRGTPVHYSRRDLVNACSYVLRTGCAWRLLPDTFPPWQTVYKAFSRSAAAGGALSRSRQVSDQRRNVAQRVDRWVMGAHSRLCA
jgi:transposase